MGSTWGHGVHGEHRGRINLDFKKVLLIWVLRKHAGSELALTTVWELSESCLGAFWLGSCLVAIWSCRELSGRCLGAVWSCLELSGEAAWELPEAVWELSELPGAVWSESCLGAVWELSGLGAVW